MTDITKTIPALLQQRVFDTPDAIAFAQKDAAVWETITWKQFAKKAAAIASGLAKSGVEPGDELAVLMPNTIAWELIQHAGFMAGCIIVGLDLNDPPGRLGHIVDNTCIKALAVQSPEMLDRFPQDLLQSLKLILVAGSDRLHTPFSQAKSLEEMVATPCLPVLPNIKADSWAILLFTSGTTGDPKVILYEHRQLVTAVESINRKISALPDQARSACWLPLASPFQRMINWCCLVRNFKTYMVQDPGLIIPLASEIRPHFLAGVPRFYEKLHEGISRKIQQFPGIVRFVITLAEKISLVHKQPQRSFLFYPGLVFLNSLADLLFFKHFRKLLGGSTRFLISGSAPLPKRLLNRCHAWGFLILESYGISENIIPMSMNTPENYCFGTVGKPLEKNAIRISGEGEILVKGVGVARNQPATDQAGFLKTGDLGYFDKNGCLCLTGRKSDTFKLSTGRKISPLMIESVLKQIPGVDHAVVIGANQKYIIALLNIHAWQQVICFHGSERKARRFLQKEAEQVTRNLPPYCRPVDCVVVSTPFSIETGELTSNLKVRRSHILETYKQEINSTYERRLIL